MSKKLRFLVGLTALLALIIAPALHGAQDEPVLKWHTYAGSSMNDEGAGIAVDSNGNVYVAGTSEATWGTPVNPYAGGKDVFVAKLNSTGELQWNTFLGSSHKDEGTAIAVDGSGNVYVVGTSDTQWGIPGDPFPGGGVGAFLAKLNSNGELQWHRFMTTYGDQVGNAVAVDASGYVYVGGWGGWVWDTPPVEPFPDMDAAFVAKLDSSGVKVWHAFLGGEAQDVGTGIAVDASGYVYVTGWSEATWGTPVNEYTEDGYQEGFAAKLDSSGKRQWHTFFGGAHQDEAWDIAVDTSGNVYVSGHSTANWGTPINPHAGGAWDAFVVKLDSGGVRQWHTFMGESMGWGIAVDAGQNVYVTGVGAAHPGFVAALNRDGVLQWNTFLEALLGHVALDRSRNVYVAGQSGVSWGTPVNPWAGGRDVFVAKIETAIELTEFSPAEVWIGLKNSDDVGTYFDLKAEVFKNSTLIGSGEIDNVRGGSSGFNNAVLRAISIALSGPDDVFIVSGDTLSIRLSARIGASGHRSGTARLWFNDAAANSSFDVTIGGTHTVLYLLDGFHLGTSPGTGPTKRVNVSVDRAKNGNPFKPFGTWSKTF